MDDLFDHRTVPEYNTLAVVNRTGVPADTFRAWERRHGLPHPARTDGNRRLYSERDIAIISTLKRMTDQGVSISHAIESTRRHLDLNRAPASVTSSLPPASPSGLEAIREQLLTAITDYDARRANGLIEHAIAMVDVESLCVDILQPVLIEIGNRWERGESTVGMEHFGTAFCMRKLSALFSASQSEAGHPTVICACVEGEHHEVGLMMLAFLLSRDGYRVIYLGANLPTPDLLSAVQRTRPDAVALSSTTERSFPHLLSAVATLRSHFDARRCPIIGYGGALYEREPHRQQGVDADYLGADARSARRWLDELIPSRSKRGTSLPHA